LKKYWNNVLKVVIINFIQLVDSKILCKVDRLGGLFSCKWFIDKIARAIDAFF